MILEHIFEFITLAETKNYLNASDTLFIAQSALSRHIQALEKELGVRLFDRSTRSVELTECGKIFLSYAREFKKLNNDFHSELSQYLHDGNNTIIVGCIPFSQSYRIPDVIARFIKQNSNYSVSLTNSSSINQLINHTADFLFIRDIGQKNDKIELLPLQEDPLAVLLPIDHPLAEKKSLSLRELKSEKFISLASKSEMYTLCVNSCLAEKFEPQIVFAGSMQVNVISMIREKIGISILAKKTLAALDLRDIAVVDIEPKLTASISLAWLKSEKRSECASHFINYVKDFYNDEV